jgi:hypothetical protein
MAQITEKQLDESSCFEVWPTSGGTCNPLSRIIVHWWAGEDTCHRVEMFDIDYGERSENGLYEHFEYKNRRFKDFDTEEQILDFINSFNTKDTEVDDDNRI